MERRREIHNRVLNAKNKEELAATYDEWAEQYDRDLVDDMGYVAPVLACQRLLGYLEDIQAKILDAGCGTGLVGAYLYQHGYRNLDGLDYSPKMLSQAEAKGAYCNLHQGDLTGQISLADNCYTAIISVGTFTSGHVGPESFHELIRITKPGGYLCFTVRDRAWEEDNYRKTMDSIEKSGAWKLIEERYSDYIREDGSNCMICVYRKALQRS